MMITAIVATLLAIGVLIVTWIGPAEDTFGGVFLSLLVAGVAAGLWLEVLR